MGIVEESKREYEQYLCERDRRMVEAMSKPEQAKFWTRLYYQMEQQLARNIAAVLEARAEARLAVSEKKEVPFSAFPMRDAETSITPHKWFTRTVLR